MKDTTSTKKSNNRIALVSNTLSSGGAEHVVANLSRILSADHQVDIILNDSENIDYKYEGHIISLGMNPRADRSSPAYQLKALLSRTRILKKLKVSGLYDAVISFSDNTNLSNVLSGSNKENGCRTIVSIRYSLEGMEDMDGRPSVMRNRILGLCCSRADAVVSCSKEIGTELVARHGLDPNKLTTIYNGIDSSTDQIKVRNTDKESGQKHIVTAGRLSEQKGHRHLITAMRDLIDQGMDVKLTILGEGELRIELKKLRDDLGLRDRVSMPGRVEEPMEYLAAADAAVFPSNFEGFCNAMVEALACGVPCVSTDHRSGAREILAPDTDYMQKTTDHIDHAAYGLLVPVCKGRAEQKLLAKAIKEILTDDEMNSRYRQAGLKRAAELDIDNIAAQWRELINEHE